MTEKARILYCHCAYARIIDPKVKSGVLSALAESGAAFEAVPDLCEMSARKDPKLRDLTEAGNVRIAACFPRAVKWLFKAGGAPLPEKGVEVLNMREEDAEEIVQKLLSDDGVAQTAGSGGDA